MKNFRQRLRYWLQTHTMNPLTWWWVIQERAYMKMEDALSPKNYRDNLLLNTEEGCAFCGHDDFTEQGLCENCGRFSNKFYGP